MVEDIVFQFNILALDGILFLEASREFSLRARHGHFQESRLFLYLDPADSLLFRGETQAVHSGTSIVLSRTWDRDKREEVRSLARAEIKIPEHGDRHENLSYRSHRYPEFR